MTVLALPGLAAGRRRLTFAGPLPQVSFCPTGGVTPTNAPDYLALPNVLCVGGSWIAAKDLMRAGDWSGVQDLARTASHLSAES